MFENHPKSRIRIEWTKIHEKCQKWSVLASFWKPEVCGQTVIPDRSVLIGQKLLANAKILKFKCDILSNFQTNVPIVFYSQLVAQLLFPDAIKPGRKPFLDPSKLLGLPRIKLPKFMNSLPRFLPSRDKSWGEDRVEKWNNGRKNLFSFLCDDNKVWSNCCLL